MPGSTTEHMRTSQRGTVPGELGRIAREPGKESPHKELDMSQSRSIPMNPSSNVPQMFRTGCNPQARRPKGQNFRVEQGVAVERPPTVVVENSSEYGLNNLTDIQKGVEELQRAAETKHQPSKDGAWECLPSRVKNCGINLTFYAFFYETVPESPLERSRVRPVNIIYSLEDDTMSLFEPRQGNSGIPQGKYLHRHKIPKSKECQKGDLQASNPNASIRGGPTFHWKDLRVGSDIQIYGKTYHIHGCDAATRRFYERNPDVGPQPEDEGSPQDKYTMERTKFMLRETGMDSSTYRGKKTSPVKRYMEAQHGNPSSAQIRGTADKYQQYLDHDRDVLRFQGYWDDSDRVFGDRHLYNIAYYLMDDEMEVLDVHEPNDGKERFPALFRKGPLPKKVMVIDSRSRDIEDDCGDDDYYHWTDLRVGKTINIFGRNILLFNADNFTLNWYKQELGVDMSKDIETHKQKVLEELCPESEHPAIEPPPYENFGFGTEEDSLGSFFYLVPKVPRRDVTQLTKGEGQIVRYYAELAADNAISKERKFIVAYYPATAEIAVFERAVSNSGMDSGKFLSKRRLRNPDTNDYFRLEDFHIGATLTICSHRFHLYDADKLTKRLVKDADGRNGIGKGVVSTAEQSLREQIQQQRITRVAAEKKLRPHHNKMMDYLQFKEVLQDWKVELSEEDLSTLFKEYDHSGTGKICTDLFLDSLIPCRKHVEERNHLKCPCSVDAYEEMLSDNVISKPAKKRLEKLHEDMENHMMRKLEEVIENHRIELLDRKEFRKSLRKAVNYDDLEIEALEAGYMPPQIDAVPPLYFLRAFRTQCPYLY